MNSKFFKTILTASPTSYKEFRVKKLSKSQIIKILMGYTRKSEKNSPNPYNLGL